MEMRPQAAFILPYFGKWPEWIDLYFLSCEANPFIDFYIFTDCPPPTRKKSNITFIPISFEEYCKKVSRKLHIRFAPANPYKLCDLKPFYGAIHEDLVSRYAYWAFGDCDLIYGDMRPIGKLMAQGYRLITTHSFRIAGHFTAVKNSSRYSRLCFKIRDWREKLENPQHLSLDELDWSSLVYPELWGLKQLYKLVKPIYRRGGGYLRYLEQINPFLCNRITGRHFHEYNTTPEPADSTQEWTYNLVSNCLQAPDGKSLIYLHFLFFKKTPYLETENYWRADFYKIPTTINFENQQGAVRINCNEIRLTEDDTSN